MSDPSSQFPLFKRLGFNTANQWMLYDDGAKDFLFWIAETMCEDNFVDEDEIIEYEKLGRDRLLLEGDNLREGLSMLLEAYPGIFELSEEDVEAKLLEYQLILAVESDYQRTTAKMKCTNANLDKELPEVRSAIFDIELHSKEQSSKGLSMASELQDLQKDVRMAADEMNHSYTKPSTPPLFIHQMPFGQYHSKCDQFMKYHDMYMQQNFRTLTNTDVDEKHMLENDLEDIRTRLLEESIQAVQKEGEWLGIHGITNYMNETWQPMTYETMKMKSVDLARNKERKILRRTILSEDLQNEQEVFVNREIESILHEHNGQKLTKTLARLQNLKTLGNIVSESLSNAELMWILIQLELNRFQNKFDNLEQMQQETFVLTMEMESISEILKLNREEEFRKEFLDNLSSIICQNPREENGSDINAKDCMTKYSQMLNARYKNMKLIDENPFQRSHMQCMNEIDELQDKLSSFVVFTTSRNQILRYPLYRHYLLKSHNSKEDLEQCLSLLKANYKSAIHKKQTDKFWSYQQKLWIWFLTDPERILHVLNELKVCAAETQSNHFKKIAGIRSRNRDE